MPFNDQDQNKKDTSFISEKIKQRPINRKKLLRRTLITASLAVVFGLVSCLTFLLLQPLLTDKLYPESQPEKVAFPEESASDELTPEEMYADDNEIAESEALNNDENQKNQIDQAIASYTFNESDYDRMITSLKNLANEASKSIVKVTGITNNSDWFSDSFENSGASGVICYDNGPSLYILVPFKAVKNAKSIRVKFSDNSTADGEMCLADSISEFCVISVKTSTLSDSTREHIEIAQFENTNFGNLTGVPVIAIGSPTGIHNSISIGLITSDKSPLNLIDSNYKLITTDILGNTNSTGAIIGLNGKFLGIINMDCTNKNKNKKNSENISNNLSAIAISELRGLITDLSNQKDRAYFGIHGTTVPVDIQNNMDIPAGAYVISSEMSSPAMRAGIQSGDIIIKLDDSEIISFDQYLKKLADYSPNDIISVTVMRQSNKTYTEINTQVTLESATHD